MRPSTNSHSDSGLKLVYAMTLKEWKIQFPNRDFEMAERDASPEEIFGIEFLHHILFAPSVDPERGDMVGTNLVVFDVAWIPFYGLPIQGKVGECNLVEIVKVGRFRYLKLTFE